MQVHVLPEGVLVQAARVWPTKSTATRTQPEATMVLLGEWINIPSVQAVTIAVADMSVRMLALCIMGQRIA